VHLLWHKDDGKFTKQLREELLEVLNHTHTKKRDQKSVFYRRTIKPGHRTTEAYIHGKGSHIELDTRQRES